MWNIQANIYLDEEAKQKDPVIGDLLEKVMNKYVQFMYYMYHQLSLVPIVCITSTLYYMDG